MTATISHTRTDEVLAEMLTENTGRHMLDSGGAYGRAWERNQGKTLETFLAAPAAYISHDYVVLDLFHYLRDRLEYDAELDARLQAFSSSPERENYAYLQDAEDFAVEVLGIAESDVRCINTYNGEEALSQTIQYIEFGDTYSECYGTDEDEDGFPIDYGDVVLLQIHGGCDVRGGYTAPRAFRRTGETFGYDVADYELYCDHDDTPMGEPLPGMPQVWVESHRIDVRGGEMTDRDGSFVRADDLWEDGEMFRTDEDADSPFTYMVACPYCLKDGRISRMVACAPYAD